MPVLVRLMFVPALVALFAQGFYFACAYGSDAAVALASGGLLGVLIGGGLFQLIRIGLSVSRRRIAADAASRLRARLVRCGLYSLLFVAQVCLSACFALAGRMWVEAVFGKLRISAH